MIFLRLFYEFFKVGLFSIGGGLATIPFLSDMGARTGWFSAQELADMIAVSESTPGPVGVNMATYVGFHTGGDAWGVVGGLLGGVIATLGLICPAIVVIAIIAGFLKKFRGSRGVQAVFYGLRPASTALITAALAEVVVVALMFHQVPVPAQQVMKTELFYWPAIALAAAVFLAMQCKPLKKLHPIVFIGISALVGIVFQL